MAEEEEDDQEPRVRTVKKQSEMLFVRGGSLRRMEAQSVADSAQVIQSS